MSWVQLLPPDSLIEVGASVGTLVHHLGFWALNTCRIAHSIEDDGSDQRYSFAYGTPEDHAESGEERFSIGWRQSDDSVWYDILVFFQPNHILTGIAYPLARQLQTRFARDSQQAMVRAVKAV